MAFRRPFFTFYVGLVIVAGFLLFPLLYVADPVPGRFLRSGYFWVFTALVVAAEQLPLRIPRGDREGELTVSTTFAFALLLVSGPAAAGIALALATAVADLRRRKRTWKVLFNVAQYEIAIAAASTVVLATGTWYAGSGGAPAVSVLRACSPARCSRWSTRWRWRRSSRPRAARRPTGWPPSRCSRSSVAMRRS